MLRLFGFWVCLRRLLLLRAFYALYVADYVVSIIYRQRCGLCCSNQLVPKDQCVYLTIADPAVIVLGIFRDHLPLARARDVQFMSDLTSDYERLLHRIIRLFLSLFYSLMKQNMLDLPHLCQPFISSL